MADDLDEPIFFIIHVEIRLLESENENDMEVLLVVTILVTI